MHHDEPRPSSLHALIAGYLQTQREVIVRGDVVLGTSPEPIHKARVAIRRYRSVLRVFAEEFQSAEVSALDEELRWYAGALGAVRDIQVLGRHLEAALGELDSSIPLAGARAAIARHLLRDESAARRELSAVVASPRFLDLLATLDRWQSEPPLARSDRGLKEVVQYVDAAERRAARKLRRAPKAHDHNEALHSARKAGKRARYAAEVGRPVLGASAARRIAAAKATQNSLGIVQDSTVALDFIRLVAADPSTDGAAGFALGLLWMSEQRRQARALRAVD